MKTKDAARAADQNRPWMETRELDSLAEKLRLTWQRPPPQFTPLTLCDRLIGYAPPPVVDALDRVVSGTGWSGDRKGGAIDLARGVNEVTRLTRRFVAIEERLVECQVVAKPSIEQIYVRYDLYHGAGVTVPRSLAIPLGLLMAGVHLNALTETENGAACLWLSRRSRRHPFFPGSYDNMAAGLQSAGQTSRMALVMECKEEAGLPGRISRTSVRHAIFQYCMPSYGGLARGFLHVFELALMPGVSPLNRDGKVDAFCLLELAMLEKFLKNAQIKPVALVAIADLCVRRKLFSEHAAARAVAKELQRNRVWPLPRNCPP